MNQLFTIRPYYWNGLWVFDDPRVGLEREPLIEGMPEIIEAATAQAGIEDPRSGFVAIFSGDPFPNALKMEWVREEGNGNVYRWEGREGWLCPALLKYFTEAPATIYVQVRALGEAGNDFDEWLAEKRTAIETAVERLVSAGRSKLESDAMPWLTDLLRVCWQAGFRAGRESRRMEDAT